MLKIFTEYKDNLFFFGVTDRDRLEKIKRLLELYDSLGLIKKRVIWLDWENTLTLKDIKEILQKTKDISVSEVQTFLKYRIRGVDVFEKLEYALSTSLLQDFDEYDCKCHCYLGEETLEKIRPLYLELFGEEKWKEVTQD